MSAMRYVRMPIEVESPEEAGYATIAANLAESSMPDVTLGSGGLGLDVGLDTIVLGYGDHRGEPALRRMIAAEAATTPDAVLLTPGAAGALFIVQTALLGAGDHLVVVRPNYATNIETPRAIGCDVTHLDLSFDDAWRLDPDAVAAAITERTRVVSITTPHNPTGTVVEAGVVDAVSRTCAERGCVLLVDETYRDLTYGDPGPPAAALGPHVVSVSSLSKAYGLPGIRVGWIVCTDPALVELFLAAKEQTVICGSVLDEAVAADVYRRRHDLRRANVAAARAGLEVVRTWIAGVDALEWVEPAGGAVCFPRLADDAGVDAARFHQVLREDMRTWVGPGHWFEQPLRYFRVGFGWPPVAELQRGLANVEAAIAEAGRGRA